MHVRRLYIVNYRSIRELDLRFEKGKNVVIGPITAARAISSKLFSCPWRTEPYLLEVRECRDRRVPHMDEKPTRWNKGLAVGERIVDLV